jgi:hypothetical protein
VGIFVSPDPMHPEAPGVGSNRYAYAFGNAVNRVDPSGLQVASPCVTWWTNNSAGIYCFLDDEMGAGGFGGGSGRAARTNPFGVGSQGTGGGGRSGVPPVKPAILDLKNLLFLYDFVRGGGGNTRHYSSDTVESQEMQDSDGAAFGRDAFVAANCQTTAFDYGTSQAAFDTVILPISHMGGFDYGDTSTQVGGFVGRVTDRGDGTVTFDILNRAGAESAFLHLVSDRTGTSGPFSTITQTFQWNESRPSSCR